MTVFRAGDLVWVDFDPAFGHEQAGRRPALVMSISGYNEPSSFILVCPVTRTRRPWPFAVELPAGGAVEGCVLVDQIKAIDKRRIVSPIIDRLPENVFEDLRSRLMSIVRAEQQAM